MPPLKKRRFKSHALGKDIKEMPTTPLKQCVTSDEVQPRTANDQIQDPEEKSNLLSSSSTESPMIQDEGDYKGKKGDRFDVGEGGIEHDIHSRDQLIVENTGIVSAVKQRAQLAEEQLQVTNSNMHALETTVRANARTITALEIRARHAEDELRISNDKVKSLEKEVESLKWKAADEEELRELYAEDEKKETSGDGIEGLLQLAEEKVTKLEKKIKCLKWMKQHEEDLQMSFAEEEDKEDDKEDQEDDEEVYRRVEQALEKVRTARENLGRLREMLNALEGKVRGVEQKSEGNAMDVEES